MEQLIINTKNPGSTFLMQDNHLCSLTGMYVKHNFKNKQE